MGLSYRNKLRLRKLLRFFLILLAVVLAVSLVLLVYVEPFVIYDREGVRLELDREASSPESTEEYTPPVISNPQILYSQDPIAEKTIAEMGGYYITTKMLQNPQTVLEAVKAIQEPCAVLIELKSMFGNFYYTTGISGAPAANVDTAAVDEIISYLNENHFYLIGVVSAFADRAFALEHISCGLPLKSGALWVDVNNCYWLDPGDDLVVSYLMEITRELGSLGFDEIAFDNFYFPDSSKIIYEGDKSAVISQTISELISFSQGSSIQISFVTEQTDFPAQDVQGRLYFPNVDGSKAQLYDQSYADMDNLQELVFLASSRDVRFEGKALLRPLLSE